MIASGALLACLATAPSAEAAQPKISVKTAKPRPDRWTIPFDEVVQRSIVVELADVTSGQVEVYAPGATAAARAARPCLVSVASGILVLTPGSGDAACRDLLAPLDKGNALEVAVSAPEPSGTAVTAVYAIVAFAPPPAYAGGKETSIEVTLDKDGKGAWPLAFPAHVALAGNDCWVFIDQARKMVCTAGKIAPSDELQRAIEAQLRRGDTMTLYAFARDADSVAGGWRAFSMKGKAEEADDSPKPLAERCHQGAKSKGLARLRPFYLVCVDAYADGRELYALGCDDDGKCSPVFELVQQKRPFVVRTWTEPGTFADVTLQGEPGVVLLRDTVTSPLKALGAPARRARKEGYTDHRFDSRKPGKVALTVRALRPKANEAPTEVAKVERTFVVEASYSLVVRFGFGVTWAPYARRAGLRTTADGQQFVDIVEGEENGLFSTEIVAGFSWFPWAIRESSLSPGFALGLRLGVVTVGDGDSWFRSLMIGPELTFGPDFSIGVFAGLVRHDPPASGYEPGTMVPPQLEEIPTQFGVTPGFSIVLNFTSDFLEIFGVSP
jgi:hypothetical protein